MATVGEPLHRWLTHASQTYEALARAALADGIAHYAQESGQDPAPVPQARVDQAIGRLNGFYQRSLVRIHEELYALAAQRASRAEIDTWFARNQRRIEQALEGLLWSAGEAGYALAAGQFGEQLYWNLDTSASHHCEMCPAFADGSPYNIVNLPAFPGDGTSECGSSCLCFLTAGAPDSTA